MCDLHTLVIVFECIERSLGVFVPEFIPVVFLDVKAFILNFPSHSTCFADCFCLFGCDFDATEVYESILFNLCGLAVCFFDCSLNPVHFSLSVFDFVEPPIGGNRFALLSIIIVCPFPVRAVAQQGYFFPNRWQVTILEGEDEVPIVFPANIEDGSIRIQSIPYDADRQTGKVGLELLVVFQKGGQKPSIHSPVYHIQCRD